MFFSVALSVLLAAVASAQSTTLQLQSIEAQFAAAGLVGNNDLLASFNPSAVLDANFGSGSITPGSPQSVAGVANAPALTLTPANSSVTFSGQYTVAMVDADIVGTNEATTNQTRHWLVNGVSTSGNTVNALAGTNITAYGGPLPAAGSGPHRYVILVYTQPSTFTAPADLPANSPISAFNFANYVQSSGLGSLVAATYFTVEQGTASMSIPATTAVQTNTLPAAQTTGGAASGHPSGTASGSGPKPTQSNGSFIGKSVSWGLAGVALLFATL
ncbi:hypothetical protein BOTBODRAFT_52916 [Botryobasidium botryosum FD-172 SS1]|uniref:PEBP-like protein n=1 Tax=Botryobasidium botryosum (strain FD-172 SS1) TaxID=930990 RepID=A0A067N1T3_BOTB1|nr:hypothetical protein BOTBODRAFT_52916 [Botryobasidium botryosum FD-172 SS1]